MISFNELRLSPELLEILKKIGFSTPTPIQEQAIPIAIDGKDVVGIAQTGTGKTLAFGLPMIQRLRAEGGMGLVVLPTRELAIQVDETLQKIGGNLGLRTAILIGGASMYLQIQALSRKPHIIIATPGRLNDHLSQGKVSLASVRVAVLDEADRMLDMGFYPQIQKIFQTLPADRQTMLFSATMPTEIMNLAVKYMKMPVRIEVAPAGTTAERVTQELFIVSKDQKIRLLEKLLGEYKGSTLIFSRTKYGAKRIVHQIREMGLSAAEIHSNRSLGQRREALEGFKTGRYRILVATDIASRGIDVTGIELVLNYDLPGTADDYVHRIGRTARAGAGGHAITFAMPVEIGDIRAIERLIRKPLPISKVPLDLPPPRASVLPFSPGREGFGRGGFGGGRRGSRGGDRSSGPRSSSPRGGSSRPSFPSIRPGGAPPSSGFRRARRFGSR